MKNYSEMSDFEINCSVAALLGKELFHNPNEEMGRRRKSFLIEDVHRDVFENGAWSSDVFDPCKYWDDAGPIIERSGISLRKRHDGGWRAENEWGISHHHDHEKPRRAAMIVFLMMHEAQHE